MTKHTDQPANCSLCGLPLGDNPTVYTTRDGWQHKACKLREDGRRRGRLVRKDPTYNFGAGRTTG